MSSSDRSSDPALDGEQPTRFEPVAHSGSSGKEPAQRSTAAMREHAEDAATLELLFPSRDETSLGLIGGHPVECVLGRGAMGIVLKAFDPALYRNVAIKVLSPELAASATFRRRFMREARAAAAINHPNVVTIHAVGDHRGLPYLVMEYIAGRTLAERIKAGPPLEVPDILRIAVQVADGLESAHRHGLVHRDVKPSNIMLEDSIERVKITDFGLARAALDQSELTSLGRVVGTPAYMPPEQISGDRVDNRSDLFALGCVIHAMVTGRSPFRGGHTVEIMHRIHEVTPPALSEIDPRVPVELSQIVCRLLEKKPENRYASAAQVSSELAAILSRQHQASSGTVPTPAPAKYSAIANRRTTGRRLLRSRWGLAATAPALILAALLWFWPSTNETPPGSAGSSATLVSANTQAQPADADGVLTVGRTEGSEFHSLGEALARAQPGMEIRVLDEGPYEENLRIDQPRLWSGLKLTSPQHAVLRSGRGESVLAIADTPNVLIDGFRIQPGVEQFAIAARGAAEGLTLQNLTVEAPADALWAAIYVAEGAAGTAQNPIQILNSTMHFGNLGMIFHAGEAPIRHVRVAGNRFLGPGTHIQLLKAAQHIEVGDNVFVGGKGLTLMLKDPAFSSSISVSNNTFFGTRYWLNPGRSSSRISNVRFHRNLICGGGLQPPEGESVEALALRWEFSENWWRPDPMAEDTRMQFFAGRQDGIEFLSEDPNDPDFLVPRTETVPGFANHGGDPNGYVGAFPPRGSPASRPPKGTQ